MLILPIKKKWFDMILSGEKKEEYREIKPYYMSRFTNIWEFGKNDEPRFIRLKNGYGKNAPSIVIKCTMDVDHGLPEWGAEDPNKWYYVLHIKAITEGPDGKPWKGWTR